MKKLIVLIGFLFPSLAYLQTTGSFEQIIAFQKPDYPFTRTLHFYVPSNYDPSLAYPLVIGFRGGPHSNAGQFRDQLKFLADSINAIIVCPENAAHFNNQEGLVKQLFRYAVDTVSAQYTIDPEKIYLTGLSYGGRHAVIVGMDTDYGPIPKLKGLIPFAPGTGSALEPNYNDIMQFAPVCICIGLNDQSNFQSIARQLHLDILSHSGRSQLIEIPGIGHTVAFPDYPKETMKCIRFIDDQLSHTSKEKFETNHRNALSVYPNPVASILFFKPAPGKKFQEIYLSNMQGKKILQIDPKALEINVSNINEGIYYLSANSSESSSHQLVYILHHQ